MERFRISGGKKIKGRTSVCAAKNAVLPILASSVMAQGEVSIANCPRLRDIDNMLYILESLGCVCAREGSVIVTRADDASNWHVPPELSGRLRSSIFMMGPLIARFRRALVTYPGGCDIGQRPIDLHLKGLRALGVRIHEERGLIHLDGARLSGGEVLLDFPSVGATENVMMAACMARGRSVILNAAREPEIADLAAFLNKMGARIAGAGSGSIVIDGVEALSGVEYTPVADRIVAGTLLVAAAATGGEITVAGARAQDMYAVTDKLREAGCEIGEAGGAIHLHAKGGRAPAMVVTQPFPGFPTDMQAQMMALMAASEGTGVIVENVFENRFAHAAELRKMGAEITVSGRCAIVRGGKLRGARVNACDLRAGAALTIAALAAEGETEVTDVKYIDRGYESLELMLRALGAEISRLADEA